MFRLQTTVATTLALVIIAGGTAVAAAATLTTIAQLTSMSNDALVLGPDGQLYGAVGGGRTKGDGYVFKVSTAGTFTMLADLGQTVSGRASPVGLVFDKAGNIFGTASASRNVGARGTVFNTRRRAR
jgi:uncharacterized repeat protein (TIGR03803 family)